MKTDEVKQSNRSRFQLRLFSRDQPLSIASSLYSYRLDSEPLVLSIFDSSLLVYTADNTFYHFLIKPSKAPTGAVKLRLCGSIGFEGVVKSSRKVRGVSWLVPKSQQRELFSFLLLEIFDTLVN